jgi:hypothetical protein
VNSGVVHLGAPGRCYGCNGTGVQLWVSADVVLGEKQAELDKHIAEVRGLIAIAESVLADDSRSWLAKKGFQQSLDRHNRLLGELLERSVSAARGEWRPAPRQKVGV